MAISSLLSITSRKNLNYEPEALKNEEIIATGGRNDIAQLNLQMYINNYLDNLISNDSITIGNKTTDLLGNISGEDIYTKVIAELKSDNKFLEIIATNENVTIDEIKQLLSNQGLGTPPIRLKKIKFQKTNNVPKRLYKKFNPKASETPPNPAQDIRVVPEDIDYTLTRKTDNTKEISIQPDQSVTIKLSKAFNNKYDYYYTIKNNDKISANIKLEYLDNGRFLIVGDNLKITAIEEQEDDLIIIGNNNQVDTNSENDTVRVGIVNDSTNYFMDYWYDEDDNKYYYNTFNNNVINTGSGNDYIQNAGGNTIDAGSGNDKLYDHQKYITQYPNSGSYINVEKTFGTTVSDNVLGWGMQGGYGDCKFLSFLNSICSKEELKNYVKITQSNNNNYNVKFLLSNKSVSVTSSDLDEINNSSGDIDFILTEIAFRKLIENYGYNMDNDSNDDEVHNNKMLGESINNWLISKYFFGEDSAGFLYFGPDDNGNTQEYEGSYDCFNTLLNAYNSGDISNLVVGTNNKGIQDSKLGIICGHAYAVIDGIANNWIKLQNPWDNNDVITLDWDDFLKYFTSANLFGNTYTYCKDILKYKYLIEAKEGNYNFVFTSNNSSVNEEASNYNIIDEIEGIQTKIDNIVSKSNPSSLKKLFA